jgi:hypothetical protein
MNFLAEQESIRYNAVHYGYSFDYSCRPYCWRNREAIDAGKRSWWFYRYNFARHRWRVDCYLPRPGRRLVQGRTTSGLDHVGRRRNDSVAALPIAFQAQTVATACHRFAVLAAASSERIDQVFAAANASTLISSAGFVEREFRASTLQRFNEAAFALSREYEMIIAPWPSRKER